MVQWTLYPVMVEIKLNATSSQFTPKVTPSFHSVWSVTLTTVVGASILGSIFTSWLALCPSYESGLLHRKCLTCVNMITLSCRKPQGGGGCKSNTYRKWGFTWPMGYRLPWKQHNPEYQHPTPNTITQNHKPFQMYCWQGSRLWSNITWMLVGVAYTNSLHAPFPAIVGLGLCVSTELDLVDIIT